VTPDQIARRLAPILLTFTIGAGPVAAAPATHIPDFNGYWVISKEDAPNFPVRGRPDPGGMPRGWIVFDGYTGHGNSIPPLRPGLMEGVRRYMTREVGGVVQDEGARKCLPANGFDMVTRRNPVDIIQRPDEVMILPEHERSLPRHIYIGGKHPPKPAPTVNGHSIGHWEGETLVVDTVGLDPRGFLLATDYLRLSADLHVSERIHMENGGEKLVMEWVFDDPKKFTHPWRVVGTFDRAAPSMETLEEICDTDARRR
jgi:hypothetical protein